MNNKQKIESLERSLAITEMLEQALAYQEQPERVKHAQKSWDCDECHDDYAHAGRFNLTLIEQEDLLDWMSNQRDYARMVDSGIDDFEAHCQARDDRRLLRKSNA